MSGYAGAVGSSDPAVGALALIAAVAVGLAVPRRPLLAFGLLFLTASLSMATFETPFGTMRPEMPAVAAAGIALLVTRGPRRMLAVPRPARGVVAGFLIYLIAISASSALVAPGTMQSLFMVAWLVISMAAGWFAFLLVAERPQASIGPLAWSGSAMGVLGVGAAIVYWVAGPYVAPGIQDPLTTLPRVTGLAWETNLYASLLAICVFFAFELVRQRPSLTSLAALGSILVGFPLGITRGAYLALAAGVMVVIVMWLQFGRSLRPLARPGIAAGAMLAVGLICTAVLLPPITSRLPLAVTADATASPDASPVFSSPPLMSPSAGPGGHQASPQAATPSLAPSPAASEPARPVPNLAPPPDTIAFRLERVPIALAEIPQSPLIGFGAESFGQRHPDRYAGAGQDHIAILVVVAPYESGLVGFAGLLVGFLLLLRLLWRRAHLASNMRDMIGSGTSVAFAASIVTMLVAYQATNSIHMAINWILMGAALALGVERDRKATPDVHPVTD